MSANNDSHSILDKTRIFPQHQSILSIIQMKLANPNLTSFKWLDVGCGKGQIIEHLEENFSENARRKIILHGYDINYQDLNQMQNSCDQLNLLDKKLKTGEIEDLDRHYNKDEGFSFITISNCLHEFSPRSIAKLLYDVVVRLDQNGILFIYDMETLPDFELGALTWNASDIKEIFQSMFNSMSVERYLPEPGRWKHSRCTAWNINIQKDLLGVDQQELIERETDIVTATEETIKGIIETKYRDAVSRLNALTRHRDEDDELTTDIDEILREFWGYVKAREELLA
jgi:ubiquinone/menaquinone biosynthesis C-methylase UbiE